MTLESTQRSKAWYLLPLFFTVIGGLIAYFVIRKDDPKKAKNCFIIGAAITLVAILGQIIIDTAVILYGSSLFW